MWFRTRMESLRSPSNVHLLFSVLTIYMIIYSFVYFMFHYYCAYVTLILAAKRCFKTEIWTMKQRLSSRLILTMADSCLNANSSLYIHSTMLLFYFRLFYQGAREVPSCSRPKKFRPWLIVSLCCSWHSKFSNKRCIHVFFHNCFWLL